MSLDDFRDAANESAFDDDADEGLFDDFDDAEFIDDLEDEPLPPKPKGNFLGMTAMQRFVIAVLLLMTSCVMTTFCLIVTGRIIP
jgi:hypothetical protein